MLKVMKTRRTRDTHAGRATDQAHAIFETRADARVARRGSTRVEPEPAQEGPHAGRGALRHRDV